MKVFGNIKCYIEVECYPKYSSYKHVNFMNIDKRICAYNSIQIKRKRSTVWHTGRFTSGKSRFRPWLCLLLAVSSLSSQSIPLKHGFFHLSNGVITPALQGCWKDWFRYDSKSYYSLLVGMETGTASEKRCVITVITQNRHIHFKKLITQPHTILKWHYTHGCSL